MFTNYLIEGARLLFEGKKYEDSAQVLEVICKYVNDKFMLNQVYSNLRMCYFLANNVPKALEVLELQEQLGFETGYEIYRDKANFLRYMNRHEEAYETALKISHEKTKLLALGWFKHKEGKIREAFYLTEESRKNDYWWKKNPNYPYKLWDGNAVETLVVVEESGFGDQIIFARYFNALKKLAKKVYYDGKGLTETFCRVFEIEPVSSLNKTSDKIDVVPIMSLAYFLNADDPSPTKYLFADQTLVSEYNSKFPKTKKRIGLCVQGEKNHVETTLRTLPLNEMVENLKHHGEIVNLQKEVDVRHQDIKYIPFETWDDTLALIDTCDVVVTCDTSVSHAAASMGKKTIVLMHAAAYFTWNHNADMSKTIWYENAYCVHQDTPCDWSGSIKKCLSLL